MCYYYISSWGYFHVLNLYGGNTTQWYATAPVPPASFSDVTYIAWNWPQENYFKYQNKQTLRISYFSCRISCWTYISILLCIVIWLFSLILSDNYVNNNNTADVWVRQMEIKIWTLVMMKLDSEAAFSSAAKWLF